MSATIARHALLRGRMVAFRSFGNLWTTNAHEIYHAGMANGAGSFASATRLDATTFRSVEPVVVIGADNTVHVAFHDDNNGNWEVAYAKQTGGVGSFSSPAYITSPGLVDATVSLATGADGALRMSWQGTGTVFLATNTAGTWSTPQVLAVEIGATVTSVAVDGFNRTYVLAEAQKTGVTAGGTRDLWSYADAGQVVGRNVFYNNSFFDGKNAAQNAQDDAAIAMDKAALIPGGVATLANYTSFDKGINGVMFDIAGLPAATSSLANGTDLELLVGNVSDPSSWIAAPAPAAIGIRRGAGVGGSDRVTLTFADKSIVGKWLRVQVRANGNTGLASPDYFLFGNAPGESGNSASNTFVDGIDLAGARDNPRGFTNRAPIDFKWDYNRDSFVDGTDIAIARDNPTGFSTSLKLLQPPAIPATPAGSPWAITGAGYEGDYRTAAASSAAGTAWSSWTFGGLATGTYELQFTWQESPGNASNAPVTISVGSGTGRQELVLNETLAPSGLNAGGRTFQTIASLTVPAGQTNYAFRIFLVGRGNGNFVADAVRLYTPPQVEDITYNLDAADGVGAKEIDPDVVADSSGNLHQVYVAGPNSNDNFRVFYRNKPLGGSWSNPVEIAGTGGAGGTRIARDSSNNLYVVYHDNNQVWIIKRAAAGGAWTSPTRLSGTYPDGSARKALWPNVAIDPQNRIHVVWHENTAAQGDSSVYYVFYRIFENGAWQPTEQVNTTTAANSADPDIAVASDGRAFVTWTGPGSPAPMMFRERNAAGGWLSPVTIDSKRSGGSSITVDANNNPHVTWIEDTTNGSGGNNWDSVYRARINGVWGTTKVFANPDGVDVEPKLAIKPNGSMTIIWADYNDLYIARSNDGINWGATAKLKDECGSASINLIYDPVSGAIHMVSGARKLGYTYSDSWDVLYYTE